MTKRARLPVIVNRSGGTARAQGGDLGEQVRKAFADADTAIDLELVAGDELTDAIRRHRSDPRLVVGGGDGTIASAAHILADSPAELAVLPLGTRNHFARQLGIADDLGTAAQAAATGAAIAVDLGQAGQRSFINNASLGAYVELVREREQMELPKGLGSLLAGWRVLRKLRPYAFDLTVDGKPQSVRTAMLFIGNNRYEIAEGRPAERRSLDGGLLSLFALGPISRGAVVRSALRVMLGRPDMAHDFAVQTNAGEITVNGSGSIEIALDGERTSLPLPLTLAIRRRALRVVVPSTKSQAVQTPPA